MIKALKNGGLFAAVEGAFVGAFLDGLVESLAAGSLHVDWRHLLAMSGAAGVIALRNYVKQSPRETWTPEERAKALENK